MDIFIDFDGTITDPSMSFEEAIQSPPQEGAIESINKLYDAGHNISIYSCRSNQDVVGSIKRKMLSINQTALERKWVSQTLEDEMIEYLNIHKIKFHTIVKGKPHYHMIIDDRAFNPNTQGWKNIKI
jgi:histidinol phosphatase-like enzyme